MPDTRPTRRRPVTGVPGTAYARVNIPVSRSPGPACGTAAEDTSTRPIEVDARPAGCRAHGHTPGPEPPALSAPSSLSAKGLP